VDDPSILGLGDVQVRHVEKKLPGGGRLDLLLVDEENERWYELELMLGATDESHIIRCVEYWDYERRHRPKLEHCAVLVAEDITSRFLNVVSLFNGCIPLVALKMTALQIGDQLCLQFVKVMDEMALGDDEEEVVEVGSSREYWEQRASKESLAIADGVLKIVQEDVPKASLNYMRNYVGLSVDGLSNNFVIFHPKKAHLRVGPRVGAIPAEANEWADKLESGGLVVAPGGRRRGRVIIRVTPDDLNTHRELLREVFLAAYKANGE